MKTAIIDFLKSEKNKKTTVEELRTVLHVSTSSEIKKLMKSLNQLIDEAIIIENNHREVTLIENTNFLVGTLDLKERGFGFVLPEDPSKNDVFIPKQYVYDAMNRDRVLVHTSKFGYGAKQEGEIKKVLERKYTHIIGTMTFRNGMGYIISDDKSIKYYSLISRRINLLEMKGQIKNVW